MLHVSGWIVGAVLLFWIVGAYNRVVRLRNELVRRFGPVDLQLKARHALLLLQIDVLAPVLVNALPRLESLRAACLQSDVARDHARARPGAPSAVKSLRLADEIVAEARARLPVQNLPGVDLAELNGKLTEVDTALAFARREFNDAVNAYNHAVREWPTVLLAGSIGFRPAGLW